MTKVETIAEHAVVTFVESAVAYLIVIPTVNWNRTVLAGAIGAGLSAAYNVVRQSTPTVAEPTVVAPPVTEIPVVAPETPPVVTSSPTLDQPTN
jgi:hypothetical protein